MKHFIFRICIFCLLSFVLFGCSKKIEEVTALANNFLVAYFQADYSKAASMCTDSFSVEFLNSLENIGQLSESVKQELIDEGSRVRINIREVMEDDNNDRNTMTVRYSLVLPDGVEEISKSLVVKKIDGIWKIASL